jgi:general secretion pathway protein G
MHGRRNHAARPVSLPAARVHSLARHPRGGGFSLLELMLVLLILGVLMSVAAWNFMGQGTQAKIDATKVSMSIIKRALDSYNLRHNALPIDLQTLVTNNELEGGNKLRDSWKRDYYYGVPGLNGRPFDLISSGPDNQRGSPDDIDYWKHVEEGK